MANITVTKLEDRIKEGLKARAARNGSSMAEEVRLILNDAIEKDRCLGLAMHKDIVPEKGLGTVIHELFKPLGGVKLG